AAELRLARNQPEAALRALNRVGSTDRQSAASRILLLRSEALFRLGRPESAVSTLLKRESVLRSRREIEENRRLIWSGLQSSGASIPPNPVARNDDPVLTGWLELGHIAYRDRTSLNSLYASLDTWRRANSDHPASGTLLNDVLQNLQALSSYPHQVALLLPLSGKQKLLGEAIRDGFMAAHFELGNDSRRPAVRIYDTDKEDPAAVYQRALLDGAAFVVGPLMKSNVNAVAPLVDGVTTLALNTLPAGAVSPRDLYQFALSPEDEARAAALRAIADGHSNAVALIENSAWGKRIQEAFAAELQARGGTLLAANTYDPNDTDHSAAIQRMLLLDQSIARRDRLAANLGKKLEFEPRRRQDVDFIFVASRPKSAKAIKPALRFHYAGDLPTYATSAIYQPGTTDNTDLNGIYFPDVPWLLEPTQNVADHRAALLRNWGPGSERMARFYALGYDSYHLSAMLHNRAGRNSLNMNGMTGTLWADSDGVVHRALKWARIEDGTTRTLPDAPRGLTQDAEIVLSQQ
ncbi:MAG: penicillin-binding protein activator, partial [Gammaproteobacteria bacterium]|nr:penicillin-binding protein activator [Gammaproteobacteria bacterium]